MKPAPVSGLQIEDPFTAPNMEYNGKTLYFCYSSCQDTFLKYPDHYLPQFKLILRSDTYLRQRQQLHSQLVYTKP